MPAGLLSRNFPAISDADSKILADGRVLVAPVQATIQYGTIIFDPVSNSITGGPTCLGNQNESSWVKLPDDSILTVDIATTNSERYIPASNTWIKDSTTPVYLWDTNGETGAAFLLADGRAFYLGASGHTAVYSPSGITNQGTWAAGPDIPDGQATLFIPVSGTLAQLLRLHQHNLTSYSHIPQRSVTEESTECDRSTIHQ